jgi:hypothetical protein
MDGLPMPFLAIPVEVVVAVAASRRRDNVVVVFARITMMMF